MNIIDGSKCIAIAAMLAVTSHAAGAGTVNPASVKKLEKQQEKAEQKDQKEAEKEEKAASKDEKAAGEKKSDKETITNTGTACLTSSVTGALSCLGIFNGNNSNSDVGGLFGIADWSDEFKIDSNAGTLDFAGTTLTVSNSDKTWSLSNAGTYASMMFVLKGGPTWSAFNMDTSVLGGSWDTQSMLTGEGSRGAGLSHWSVYVFGERLDNPPPDESPDPVPLPAAGWMLIAGIGAIFSMRRRKSV